MQSGMFRWEKCHTSVETHVDISSQITVSCPWLQMMIDRENNFISSLCVKQLLHYVPMSCCWLADLLIGPPTAFPLLGTGVPWVFLPGPTGVMTHPGRMMSHQSANPFLLFCTGVLLRCTELRLYYTDCSLDVFTCNITNLDQCCVLIVRRK